MRKFHSLVPQQICVLMRGRHICFRIWYLWFARLFVCVLLGGFDAQTILLSGQPTSQPSSQPTGQPTRQPTGLTSQPSSKPSRQATRRPSPYSYPSNRPTSLPAIVKKSTDTLITRSILLLIIIVVLCGNFALYSLLFF